MNRTGHRFSTLTLMPLCMAVAAAIGLTVSPTGRAWAAGHEPLTIIKARYGERDVWADATKAVRAKVAAGRLNSERVWCDLVGDPLPNVAKVLPVTCAIRGRESTSTAADSRPLIIDSERIWTPGDMFLGLYRNLTTGGVFQATLPILSGPDRVPDGVTPEVRGAIEDAGGNAVATVEGSWLDRQAVWNVKAETLPPGNYTFRGRVTIEQSPFAGSASFSRVAALPPWKSYLDAHGQG